MDSVPGRVTADGHHAASVDKSLKELQRLIQQEEEVLGQVSASTGSMLASVFLG